MSIQKQLDNSPEWGQNSREIGTLMNQGGHSRPASKACSSIPELMNQGGSTNGHSQPVGHGKGETMGNLMGQR